MAPHGGVGVSRTFPRDRCFSPSARVIIASPVRQIN